MSKRADNLDKDWVQQKLASLRSQLEQTGQLPETADQLLHHLQLGQSPPAVPEEDMDMLSLIVSDALQGVDIPTRYPAFFQKLLANQELREAFLDALDVLENPAQLEPLPSTPNRDLSFLKTATTRPIIEQPARGQWRATWRQTVGQLNNLFSPLEGVYRSASNFLEDDYVTLLRSEVEVEANQFDVLLAAGRPSDNPDSLNLRLTVALLDSLQVEEQLPPLLANVRWGHYDETTLVGSNGQAAFPPLPLSLVLDQANRLFTTDLEFSLETN